MINAILKFLNFHIIIVDVHFLALRFPRRPRRVSRIITLPWLQILLLKFLSLLYTHPADPIIMSIYWENRNVSLIKSSKKLAGQQQLYIINQTYFSVWFKINWRITWNDAASLCSSVFSDILYGNAILKFANLDHLLFRMRIKRKVDAAIKI